MKYIIATRKHPIVYGHEMFYVSFSNNITHSLMLRQLGYIISEQDKKPCTDLTIRSAGFVTMGNKHYGESSSIGIKSHINDDYFANLCKGNPLSVTTQIIYEAFNKDTEQ